MDRRLIVSKVEAVINDHDDLALSIDAALTEGEGDLSFAIPNICFEVALGVKKIFEGMSDARTGSLTLNNIPIKDVPGEFSLRITATDEIGKITSEVPVNVRALLEEMEARRKAKFDEERKKRKGTSMVPHAPLSESEAQMLRSQAEEAEKQRLLKVEIERDLAGVESSKAYEEIVIQQCFSSLAVNHAHPVTRRGVVKLAAMPGCVDKFINHIPYYVHASWAIDVLLILARSNPLSVMQHFPHFAKQPWAKDVALLIAENFPAVLMDNVKQIEFQPWAGEVVQVAALFDPVAVIGSFENYQDQPWAGGVLEFAKARVAELAKIEQLEKERKRKRLKAEEAIAARRADEERERLKAEEAIAARRADEERERLKAEEALRLKKDVERIKRETGARIVVDETDLENLTLYECQARELMTKLWDIQSKLAHSQVPGVVIQGGHLFNVLIGRSKLDDGSDVSVPGVVDVPKFISAGRFDVNLDYSGFFVFVDEILLNSEIASDPTKANCLSASEKLYGQNGRNGLLHKFYHVVLPKYFSHFAKLPGKVGARNRDVMPDTLSKIRSLSLSKEALLLYFLLVVLGGVYATCDGSKSAESNEVNTDKVKSNADDEVEKESSTGEVDKDTAATKKTEKGDDTKTERRNIVPFNAAHDRFEDLVWPK